MPHEVLLVDDSELDNFIAEKILINSTMVEKVVMKFSGNEALDYLDNLERQQQHFPNIILLDIKMPHMNGFEFVQLFTTYPQDIIETTSVYLLTSSNNPEDKTQAKESGFIKDYFVKPLTMEMIDKIFGVEPIVEHA
jgi:CheY-like chemotaxis protein